MKRITFSIWEQRIHSTIEFSAVGGRIRFSVVWLEMNITGKDKELTQW